MFDINHFYGNDIGVSPTGDLGSVSGLEKSQQRILRRLLTNPMETAPDGAVLPPDYIWHPEYGAGLGRFIGRAGSRLEAVGRIRSQMMLESSVAKFPAPDIRVDILSDGLAVNIAYTFTDTGQRTTLSFNINE